ncbi:MAG TPA: glycosyltransferase [Chitinophagales bacterium]|nr:glycosyltransferase [Chitinophagales bacterium]
MNKKIVFAVTNDLTYDQRMQKICRSLSHAGYTVELVGRERNTSLPLSNEPFKQTRLKCSFDKGKLFYVEYNFRLFLYLLSQKADAFCAIDLDTIASVVSAAKIKRAKIAYDAHEYFTEVPEVIRRPKVKKVWQWVEKTFVPKVDLAYTVSPAIAELFSKQYSKKFNVIMNVPVLAQRTSSMQPTNNNTAVILYQGALNEGRGLEHLIETMHEVNAKLILAGEGDLSNALRLQVKQAGLEEKVEFAGFVKPEDLRKLTQDASIGINLLENKGLSYYYSLSNKFFDYIHAGVPQVCINFPEYQQINEDYDVAVLVKDCSPQEIKKAIERLLNDKEFYARLQKKCEVCSTSLNWQNEEKKLVAFYHELLR